MEADRLLKCLKGQKVFVLFPGTINGTLPIKDSKRQVNDGTAEEANHSVVHKHWIMNITDKGFFEKT